MIFDVRHTYVNKINTFYSYSVHENMVKYERSCIVLRSTGSKKFITEFHWVDGGYFWRRLWSHRKFNHSWRNKIYFTFLCEFLTNLSAFPDRGLEKRQKKFPLHSLAFSSFLSSFLYHDRFIPSVLRFACHPHPV